MSIDAISAMSGFLIDLDGTLYHGDRRIEGADRLIRYLQAEQIPYLFVTNNSSAAPETVAQRLTDMGIPASPSDVCTSAQAAARYVAERHPQASVYAVGEAGLKQALEEEGLALTDSRPDFVVQGIDRNVRYDDLAKAVRYIRDGAAYVLTNPDLLLPSSDGLIPGAGSIGAMIKAASGTEPVLIGKPSAILMNEALRRLGRQAEHTWVVGDNMATDIAAGRAAGCGTLLVLTGLTTADNLEHYAEQAGCRPDLICGDLDELIEVIGKHRQAI